ncbi:alpha/beta hydrolase [Qipengyuania sp. SS22]|uniref:alpha/beta hydrolase n=1 Tax=Qipengyuania sp. SS22 TaxID=2979461 RepID=UPI0021E5DD5C|nr:alpha/beta hydrolase [Qipengyuania sp. SS22]UYH55785.1 alpha/beta hydrolase [Qipengyuania sp. SS22]
MNKLSLGLLTAAAGVLGACSLPSPSLSLLASDCRGQFGAPDDVAPNDVFFMASNMADCRKDSLDFAIFRSDELSYGFVAPTGQGEEPWDAHRAKLLAEDQWLAALTDQIEQPGNEGRLLLYIHGYRSDFDDALDRTVTLRNLNAYSVPTVSVVWPSRKRYLSYLYDASSIAWSQGYIDQLLLTLVEKSDNITLVAHSMGGRALVGAIRRLNLAKPDKAAHVHRLILVSPDIDRHQVLRDNGSITELLKGGRSVTIYSSQEDLALRTSRSLHGYSRLGSSDCSYSVDYAERSLGRDGNCHLGPDLPGLSMVDTSAAVAEGGLRHGDVFDTCVGRADLAAVLNGEATPWRETVPPRDGRTGYRITHASYAAQQDDCPA